MRISWEKGEKGFGRPCPVFLLSARHHQAAIGLTTLLGPPTTLPMAQDPLSAPSGLSVPNTAAALVSSSPEPCPAWLWDLTSELMLAWAWTCPITTELSGSLWTWPWPVEWLPSLALDLPHLHCLAWRSRLWLSLAALQPALLPGWVGGTGSGRKTLPCCPPGDAPWLLDPKDLPPPSETLPISTGWGRACALSPDVVKALWVYCSLNNHCGWILPPMLFFFP